MEKLKEEQAIKMFLSGLLKLPIHKISNKEYVLVEDIGKLSDKTFGKM